MLFIHGVCRIHRLLNQLMQKVFSTHLPTQSKHQRLRFTHPVLHLLTNYAAVQPVFTKLASSLACGLKQIPELYIEGGLFMSTIVSNHSLYSHQAPNAT